jgi:aminopeptidase YwaD
MHRIKIILSFTCLFFATISNAQDSTYTRKILNSLTAKAVWGRGYTKDGMKKASVFLAKEYKNIGLSPMFENYNQEFSFPVNTFPGKMNLTLNGINLSPGKDFLIKNDSPGINFKGELQQNDSVNYSANEDLKVVLKKKLTWSVATEIIDNTILEIRKDVIKEPLKTIDVDIENKFIEEFKAYNIAGLVKGTKYPDSIIFFTAHYDHLGGMGAKTFFPGANDNAAGVATLLSLAKYYSKNPQPYSIGFICFAAEEAGILGSRFYTENPASPLSKIKFLLNLDLVGTGEAGMTVVNATVYPNEFKLLNKINDEQKLIIKINSRGKAANSDHYFFTEKGVPAFFIYTQGGPNAYHDIYDEAKNLPLTEYKDLFKLIVDFNKELMK